MGKYSADVTTKFLTLEGVEFMVQRFDFGSNYVYYDVYQPATNFFTDQFSCYTHTNDGRFWGRTDSFFPEEKFAQYPGWVRGVWPEERIKHVNIYHAFQKAYTAEIARMAFDLQGEVKLG